MEIFYYLIAFILGGVIAWLVQSARSRENINEKVLTLTSTLATAQADLANSKNMQAQLKVEFQNLANNILQDSTSKLTDQNKKNIDSILEPLKSQIVDFKSRVEDVYKNETADRVALHTQIESLTKLNAQMTQDAKNLTLALKGDPKAQGDWGEMILEKILENSGLTKGEEFTIQTSLKNDNGSNVRPDVIINLPENKHFIIDSKVSLTAYERYSNFVEKTDQDIAIKEHIQSIRSHIDELTDKKYHDLYQINSPEFVFMFIPVEPAFTKALQEDRSLFNDAFKKNVIMLTPSTLFATLKVVAQMWKQEKQTRNTQEIARKSGALYDKFVGLYEDLTEIGTKINATKDVYDTAINKLKTGRGNLIKSVEDIKKLGAKASKELPHAIIQEADES